LLDAVDYCAVKDPFRMSSDGLLVIKVNGSNAMANTTTAVRVIHLHDVGQSVSELHVFD